MRPSRFASRIAVLVGDGEVGASGWREGGRRREGGRLPNERKASAEEDV
jgi:hypothetical protein